MGVLAKRNSFSKAKPFRLLISGRFKKGDTLEGNDMNYLVVIKEYKPRWWKKVLKWLNQNSCLSFTVYESGYKVKPINK